MAAIPAVADRDIAAVRFSSCEPATQLCPPTQGAERVPYRLLTLYFESHHFGDMLSHYPAPVAVDFTQYLSREAAGRVRSQLKELKPYSEIPGMISVCPSSRPF